MGTRINSIKNSEKYRQSIPDCESISSEVLVHKPSNLQFSPPALTNQWARLQVSRDISAYDDFAIPPVRGGEGKYTELFFGFMKDDFQSCQTLDLPVSYQWFPHAVKRNVTIKGLEVSTYTSLSTTNDVLQMKITLRNTLNHPFQFQLFMKLLFGLNCSVSKVEFDEERNAFLCSDVTEAGNFAIQSVDQKPAGHGQYLDWEAWYHNVFYRHFNGWKDSSTATYGALFYDLKLEPGEEWVLNFNHAMGEKEEIVREQERFIRTHFDEELTLTKENWNEEIQAAFTPNNNRFSGHFPVLETTDLHLKRIYDISCISTLCMKRTRRMGQPAKVYATGAPGYGWTHCFLWDGQMSALPIALLDPLTLKGMIEFWIKNDPSTFFATDYVTGEPEGVWYGINDFAMAFMMYTYVSVTGDYDWLEQKINNETVLSHFISFSTRFLDKMEEDYLVNYGDYRNLLECVFTYAHKVPSFNATNAWKLRRCAELLEKYGESDQAQKFKNIADKIVESVLSLYEDGKGYWNCKYPNNEKFPVRTCLDFNYLFLAVDENIPQHVKEEMLHFYQSELMTETWMHALSPNDPDTSYSMRTDHQDDGAFVSWPAFGLLGFSRMGKKQEALDWIGVGKEKGLATVTLQGPWGQAYFHGGKSSPLELRGAMKAPKEHPFIERYTILSGAMYISVIIEELFDIGVNWDGLHLKTEQNKFNDAVGKGAYLVEASLYNLSIQNKLYDIDWVF